MKKFLLLLTLATQIIFAQETCESKEESLDDLNTITKCSIEDVKKSDNKNTRQISVRISAPKKRYLTKRVHEARSVATSANTLNSSGVSETTHISKAQSLSLNVTALTKSLSAEEVKKASKFESVDRIPSFSDCKKVKKGDALGCFNKEMIKHIEKHFSYPNTAVLNKIEGKVWVRFIIDNEGNVTNIKTLGPKGAEILDEEAKRVVSKLPKFTPAENKKEKVSVKYGFPISFSLEQ